MSRLFLGNFYFEHELTALPKWRPTASMLRLAAERAVAWTALAEEGDSIWTPERIPDEFWETLSRQGLPRVRCATGMTPEVAKSTQVVPWGWSRSVRETATATATDQPSDAAVRRGNSRAWSFDLEQQLGVALPGAARLSRLEDLGEIVARSASAWGERPAEHLWVIKANFGMSARERLLGRGTRLAESCERWLQRRMAVEGTVFFEPWRPRRAEVGIQWEIPTLDRGRPKLLGVTPLLTASGGEYRGSEIHLDECIPPQWQQAVEVTENVAARLQQIGYFGPLGIDAAIYEAAGGQTIPRPLQDINARFTMGRLALGLRRLLGPQEQGLWWHGRPDESPPTCERPLREISFAPDLVGTRPPAHVSRLLIRQTA
jgi:hypothetical protein